MMSRRRMAIGGATSASPSAASRTRAMAGSARSALGGWRWRGRAHHLLVPELVTVRVELWAEREAVRLGDVGVLLLHLRRHVLPIQARVPVDAVDDNQLRLRRQQPVQELVERLLVLAVGRDAE